MKQKKIDGTSSKAACEVLDELSREQFQVLISQHVVTKHLHNVTIVEKLPEFLKKMEMEKNTIVDMLESWVEV